jgi:hypothetical protein
MPPRDDIATILHETEIYTDLPDLKTDSFWYLDDGTLVCPAQLAADVIERFMTRGPAYGLFLNLSKCTVFRPDCTPTDFPCIPAQVRRLPDGFTLLGAPQGSDDFIRDFLKLKGQAYQDCLVRSALLPHAQARLKLLIASLNLTNTYLLGLVEPRLGTAFTRSIRNSQRAFLSDLLRAPATDSAWIQTSLPRQLGGLGLDDPTVSHEATYLSTLLRVYKLKEEFIDTQTLTAAYTAYVQKWGGELPPTTAAFLEDSQQHRHSYRHRLLHPAHQKRYAEFFSKLTPAGKIRIPSLQLKGALAWLDATPGRHRDNRMSNAVLYVTLTRVLGIPFWHGNTQKCRFCLTPELNGYMNHAINCANRNHRIYMHNGLMNILTQSLRAGGNSVATEVGAPAAPNLRPADALVAQYGRDGKDFAIDGTIVNPLQGSFARLMGEGKLATPHQAMENAHAGKLKKSKNICENSNWDFLPFVANTYGGLRNDANEFVTRLGRELGKYYSVAGSIHTKLIRQRISTHINRSIANLIIAAMPYKTDWPLVLAAPASQ